MEATLTIPALYHIGAVLPGTTFWQFGERTTEVHQKGGLGWPISADPDTLSIGGRIDSRGTNSPHPQLAGMYPKARV